jgi:hypothetical protein
LSANDRDPLEVIALLDLQNDLEMLLDPIVPDEYQYLYHDNTPPGGYSGVCPTPRGGTYRLFNKKGKVMKTGRSKDLSRREGEMGRAHPKSKFKVDKRTDDYNAQRGREEIIYNQQNPPAPYDQIRPIDPANPKAKIYRDAGKKL